MYGEKISMVTLFSLLLIISGIILTCAIATFSFIGFGSAFLSNSFYALTSIYSKKVLNDKVATPLEVFYVTCLNSTLLCFIPSLLEIKYFMGYGVFYENILIDDIFVTMAQAVLYYFMYNAYSYLLLDMLSPLSHCVVANIKRLFVIYVSIFYFSTPFNYITIIASLITVTGLILYGWENSRQPKTNIKKEKNNN